MYLTAFHNRGLKEKLNLTFAPCENTVKWDFLISRI